MMGTSMERGPGTRLGRQVQSMNAQHPGVHRAYLARGPPDIPLCYQYDHFLRRHARASFVFAQQREERIPDR